MRHGRALAGLGWVGTLGGLALCVLIFLAAYVAFDDHGAGVKPRRDEIIRFPSVPDADVPRVPLGRPPSRAAGDDGGGAPRSGSEPPSTAPLETPQAPAGGSPP